jgi:transposase
MSISTISRVREDGSMSSPGPRSGGPTPRRSFTPAQKLAHLTAYQQACDDGSGGGAYLRREGIYSSQITEWRKLRDAGVLEGRKPGEKIGKLTAEQIEIARLRRQLEVSERKLVRTEAALSIMEKARQLLEEISESAEQQTWYKKP